MEVIILAVASLALAALGALIPALKAMRVDPSTGLHSSA
jgi:ABC-type lipoprotein release transport system permease subunit